MFRNGTALKSSCQPPNFLRFVSVSTAASKKRRIPYPGQAVILIYKKSLDTVEVG